MIVYILIYLIVIYCAIKSKNNKIGYLAWGTMFFFSVFRGNQVGRDTMNAMSNIYIYSKASMQFDIASSSSMEILTNSIFKIIEAGANPRIIITFYSVITFVFLLLFAKRSKVNLAFLMMVFLLGGGYVYSFNIARQWAAIAVSAYAVSFIFEENFKKSLIFFPLIIFAASIHFNSITYLIIYLVRFVHFKFDVAIFIIILGAILALILDVNVNASQISWLGDYMDNYGESINSRNERSVMGWIATLYFLFLYIYMMSKMKNHNIHYLIPIFTLCLVLNRFTESMESIIHRAFMFYGFISNSVIAKYFTVENEKDKNIVLSAYLIISTYLFFTSGIRDVYSLNFNIF